jgi:hypothetical protein
LTILCNVLISELAERTGTPRDQVIDAYALQTEGLINQLKGDLGSLGRRNNASSWNRRRWMWPIQIRVSANC